MNQQPASADELRRSDLRLDTCVCGHQAASHDTDGCVICAAQGQQCPSFWSESEYTDAVQTGLVEILKAQRECGIAMPAPRP